MHAPRLRVGGQECARTRRVRRRAAGVYRWRSNGVHRLEPDPSTTPWIKKFNIPFKWTPGGLK